MNLVKSLLPTHVLGVFSYKKVLPYFFCETISEQEWIFFEIRIRMDIIDWICIVVLHGCCQTNRCWESNSLGMIFHYTLYKEQLKKNNFNILVFPFFHGTNACNKIYYVLRLDNQLALFCQHGNTPLRNSKNKCMNFSRNIRSGHDPKKKPDEELQRDHTYAV